MSSKTNISEPKYIFITGGVVSSLGKGLAAASMGALLQAHGYSVRIRKLDPYLNVDPGTMNPNQHGEVFVCDDGAETDLDLGHYERFTGYIAGKGDNITTGQIYSRLIAKERKGDYLGGTVQVIPHVTDLIKEFITKSNGDEDFILCEIGGTIGDIEGLPYYEAIRQLGYQMKERVLFIHLTLVPYIATAGELKTKPTQHSVKELRSIGIQPDILLCRAEQPIPVNEKRKIALFCNIKQECVISAYDAKSIYEVPIKLHEEGLDAEILKYFAIKPKKNNPDLSKWLDICDKQRNAQKKLTIAIIAKYLGTNDAYKSLTEAIDHAAIANDAKAEIKWVNARMFDEKRLNEDLADVDAIIVPGGFGERGIMGKISASSYARKHKVPFLGICFGMQMAVIDCARNLAGIDDASSTEFGPTDEPIVGLMTEWIRDGVIEQRSYDDDLGGTMRLGAYKCNLVPGSKAHKIYGSSDITERHRHRYEINISYKAQLEEQGLKFSGLSPSGNLPEIVELDNHPWFIGVQFHPELQSRPFKPHPLFVDFIKTALTNKVT